MVRDRCRDVALIGFVLALSAGAISCADPPPVAPKPRRIQLITGLIGGGFYGLVRAMAEAMVRAPPHVRTCRNWAEGILRGVG
jgi:hypothetical protein